MSVVTPTDPPARIRVPVGFTLNFALFGAPLAWLLQLAFGYAVSVRAHSLVDAPLVAPGWGSGWWILLGIDFAAVSIAAAALLAAFGCRAAWRAVVPQNAGERRNRVLARWSVLISALFSMAVVFTIVRLFANPAGDW